MRPKGWRVIYADVHPDDYRFVKTLAQEHDLSVCGFVRMLVDDYLDAQGLPNLEPQPKGTPGRPEIVR